MIRLELKKECSHNQRHRYTDGFYCKDCLTFFGINTPTYRQRALLSSIWMVLHNINVQRRREGLAKDEEVSTLVDKIGIGILHDNYEELISEGEKIMSKYGEDSKSATLELGIKE